jgi:hypothetical protein
MYVLDMQVVSNASSFCSSSRDRGIFLNSGSQYVQESDFVIALPTPTGGLRNPAECGAKQVAFFRKVHRHSILYSFPKAYTYMCT